eukprot:m.498275 g.498275  ORF g.498275 m.498275 type:complete len:51 (+) comp53601_c0_seq1:79-231(+)
MALSKKIHKPTTAIAKPKLEHIAAASTTQQHTPSTNSPHTITTVATTAAD